MNNEMRTELTGEGWDIPIYYDKDDMFFAKYRGILHRAEDGKWVPVPDDKKEAISKMVYDADKISIEEVSKRREKLGYAPVEEIKDEE